MLGYVLRNNPQEIYRIHVTDNAIVFTVKKEVFQDIIENVTREEVIECFLGITRKEEGEFMYFYIYLPFITFPNYAHKGIDWEILGKSANEAQTLLFLLNTYFFSKEKNDSLYLSDNPQLMIIATIYSKTRDMHACPLELGFSEDIAKTMKRVYEKETHFEMIERESLLTYLKLSSKTKRSFEKEKERLVGSPGGMFGVIAMMRSCGIPQFSVPGNCACLGENPDTFSYSRDMFSHNLDSTLQQMTMLVAVVAFWNEVLKPLAKT